MAVLTVTGQNFETTIATGTVLLDFWAAWCGPCRVFGPIFEEAAARHPDVTFGKVDTEAEPALAEAFRIRSIPTLVVLRDGVLLAAESGVMPGHVIDDVIVEVRELDMDKVREQIAERQQQTQPTGRP